VVANIVEITTWTGKHTFCHLPYVGPGLEKQAQFISRLDVIHSLVTLLQNVQTEKSHKSQSSCN